MRPTLTMLVAICVVPACSTPRPTIGRLKKDHAEAVAAIQTGTSKAFASLLDTDAGKRQAVSNTCEAKLGAKLERIELRGRFGASQGETPRFDFHAIGTAQDLGETALGLWAMRLATDDDTPTHDTAGDELETAAKVKHVLVQKDGGTHVDYWLVDMPAGNVVCGFGVEGPPFPDYDPETGDDFPRDRSGLEQWRLDEEIDHQMMARFGSPTMYPELAPSKAQVEARAFYGKVAHGLDAMALPACTDADPAGSVRTTVKRLHAYAGLPILPLTDDNRVGEPVAVISKPFLDVVDDTQRATRDATLATLRAAPATIVVEITQLHAAVVQGLDNTYEAGWAKARAVRFDRTGAPICQRALEVRNPSAMDVTYVGSVELSLARASIADLRRQVETQI